MLWVEIKWLISEDKELKPRQIFFSATSRRRKSAGCDDRALFLTMLLPLTAAIATAVPQFR